MIRGNLEYGERSKAGPEANNQKIEASIAELKMLTDADALMGKETESEQENHKDRKSDDEADMSSMDSDKVK